MIVTKITNERVIGSKWKWKVWALKVGVNGLQLKSLPFISVPEEAHRAAKQKLSCKISRMEHQDKKQRTRNKADKRKKKGWLVMLKASLNPDFICSVSKEKNKQSFAVNKKSCVANCREFVCIIKKKKELRQFKFIIFLHRNKLDRRRNSSLVVTNI